MERISKDNVVFAMDKNNDPVARVADGARLIFETKDCFSDTVQTADDLVSGIDFDYVNPATGPVYIEGAEPGDTLKVSIHKINLNNKGAVVTSPGLGIVQELIESEETVIGEIEDGFVSYLGHKVPLRKMVGVIGVAPAGEAVTTGTPGDHGGNMDTIKISENSSVYFPVNVKGALLALGDLHAAMGDGEIMGSGLEIAGEVEVTVEVIKNMPLNVPMVENNDSWTTIAAAEDMETASHKATIEMIKFITDRTNLKANQAGMLLSIAGDLGVCQVVNPNVTMSMTIAKSVLEK